MRTVAAACSGEACDAYIPLWLLLPMLALVAAAGTAVIAISGARSDRTWFVVFGICAAAGVFGPIGALLIPRDSPEAFVLSSAVFLLAVPVSAVTYAFRRHD